MEIREIRPNDAAALLAHQHLLDRETTFMMLEPGERTTTEEQQRQRLEGMLRSGTQMIFVAVAEDGRIVGHVAVLGGGYRRNRHSAHLVAGINAAFAGQGLGTRLFAAMEAWARAHGLTRLELTVMAHNARAIALYKKMGFEVEGTKRNSLRVAGAYVDEYYMAKFLQ